MAIPHILHHDCSGPSSSRGRTPNLGLTFRCPSAPGRGSCALSLLHVQAAFTLAFQGSAARIELKTRNSSGSCISFMLPQLVCSAGKVFAGLLGRMKPETGFFWSGGSRCAAATQVLHKQCLPFQGFSNGIGFRTFFVFKEPTQEITLFALSDQLASAPVCSAWNYTTHDVRAACLDTVIAAAHSCVCVWNAICHVLSWSTMEGNPTRLSLT